MGSLAYVSGNWIQYPDDLDDQWALTYSYGALAPDEPNRLAPGGMVFMTPNGQRRLLAHAYNTASTYGYYTYGKSSADGDGSPEGWLCASTIPDALRRTASVNSSAIRTDVPATLPT